MTIYTAISRLQRASFYLKLPALARLLVVLLLLAGMQPVQAQGPGKYSLEGEWKGPLAVPGGSLPIQLIVTELASGNRFAVLNVVPQRINRIPTTVEQRGDTVLFVAEQVGCRFKGVRTPEGNRLTGIWSQPGYQTALTLEFVPPPVAAAPKSFKFPPPYRVQEVKFANETDKIAFAGTLTIPAGEGPFPAVALLSDWGAQDQDGRYGDYKLLGGLADYLTRRGIAVLRFPDRGVGETGSRTELTSPEDRTRDAQAALQFMRTQPLLDGANLGLLGHGEGGNVALLAAGRPLPPAFVITLAAAGQSGLEVLSAQPAVGWHAAMADTLLARTTRERAATQATGQARVEKMRSSGANAAQLQIQQEQVFLRQRAEEKKRLEALAREQRPLLDIVRRTPDDATARDLLLQALRTQRPNQPDSAYATVADRLTTPWTRSYLRFYPQQELAAVQCPVLLLHGTDDLLLSPDVNLSLLTKGLKGTKLVESRQLAGVNHLFQGPANEWPLIDGRQSPAVSTAALDAIRSWIQALAPPAK
ncbi:serine aminopeptidase domain-containing protein [Hymenobacter lapidiphilus]|uniref:Alpha/beta hydrolase n=1 Tax=Hymenobacter lapidiphilus TaxID=2608003 RepID=A0A7Y7PQ54_9BACT|nr:alpha/beta hydrolase [Hymenobacter lapidiphilus]NVO32004.1 alpha/beta hydrolase [Hymenobacter lapidiphilus]